MKKALLFAYYFPPLGMGGTQRVAKFVKYLPHFNWQPVVVTVKDVAYYAYDESFNEEIKNATVYRTGSLDPQRLLYLISRKNRPVASEPSIARQRKKPSILSFFNLPDLKILWLPFALVKGMQILRSDQIDCILTSSPPHSAHLIGLILKKIFGKTWIADFRDGWVGGNFQAEPTRFHSWLNFRLQSLICKKADRIVTVSNKLAENLARETGSDLAKYHVITNGYDEEDLQGVDVKKESSSFKIVHCGALTDTAPVTTFLQAVAALIKKRPEIENRLQIQFVGATLTPDPEKKVNELRLQHLAEFTGYVPHAVALQHLLRADLLLYTIKDSAGADFIPGKTFEYLASKKPVLAIGPPVEGMRLIEKHRRGAAFAHADVDLICDEIIRQIEAPEENLKFADDDIKGYSRKNLTKVLAKLLDFSS